MNVERLADFEVSFCGYCGQAPATGTTSPRNSRICRCGFGLVLAAPSHEAPSPDDAFLVIDDGLVIAAVSRQAERLLTIDETVYVDRPLTRLLVPADGASPDELEAEFRNTVDGGERAERGFRLVGALTRTVSARIGRCASPRAALLILSDDG
jgi:hypothetical protein